MVKNSNEGGEEREDQVLTIPLFAEYAPVLRRFNLMREGHPISTLNMSECALLDAPPNLEALTAVTGRGVLHRVSTAEKVVEYICGSDKSKKYIDKI